MTIVDQVAHWLAPWQSLYANSKVVSNLVNATHVVAVVWSGGLAIAADRATLKVRSADGSARDRQLLELGLVHRPVLIGLLIVFASGLLQVAADLKTFVGAPVFWLKLGLVALLVVNGARIVVTERAFGGESSAGGRDRLWGRLRLSSWLSLALWSAIVVAGVWLTSAA